MPDGDNPSPTTLRAEVLVDTAAKGGRVMTTTGRFRPAHLAVGSAVRQRNALVPESRTVEVARLRLLRRVSSGGLHLVFSPWPTADWTEHRDDPAGHLP